MNRTGDNTGVAYGVLDESKGQFVATDSRLMKWIDGGTLRELLPDVDLQSSGDTVEVQTKLCRANTHPVLAMVEFTSLLGEDQAWRLLRIQILSERGIDAEYRDAVTGLPDRRALEPQRVRWQPESSTNQVPHALLFIDLDNFKLVNDSHGHATGDKVLAILAKRWQKSLRGGDLLVRYGGDEFVVLLGGISSENEARPVMDRLLSVAAQPIDVDGLMLTVSATIGLALADEVTVSLEELLTTADQAMYAAKGEAR
jgi:diguanylate cyclase (GGDEF)-like protein